MLEQLWRGVTTRAVQKSIEYFLLTKVTREINGLGHLMLAVDEYVPAGVTFGPCTLSTAPLVAVYKGRLHVAVKYIGGTLMLKEGLWYNSCDPKGERTRDRQRQ